MRIEKHHLIDKMEQTGVQVLTELIPHISGQKLKLAMQYGAVWVTHKNKTSRLRRAKKELSLGDEVHLYFDDSILFADIAPAILVTDEVEYSVWNKPCGMFSQGTKWGDHTAIARWVELFGLSQNDLSSRPCFLVHRLDRATNGLILLAHSKKMASKLAELFENRKIIKKYKATISGEFPDNMVGEPIELPIDNKPAVSLVESVDYNLDQQLSTLLIEIKTGRKHQIRRHLSELGFPIIGDRLYGKKQSPDEKLPDLMLQSCFLEFVCPVCDKVKKYRPTNND